MPEKTARPDWVDETPAGDEYSLIVFENGEGMQEVDMTREEFIALKTRLAEMRGYKLP